MSLKNNKQEYLHGFSDKEQKRLIFQAKFLEEHTYENIDFSQCKRVLEVGCGVGAQTLILRKRFPNTRLVSIDSSPRQIETARHLLKKEINRGDVILEVQDAQEMHLPDKSFDGAFLCWFLEHVPKPQRVLKEVRRLLKRGSVIYCTEVQNASLFVEPYSPAIIEYWFRYNDVQWNMKGHPFVGAQLGHLLSETGFKNVDLKVRPFLFDSRQPRKRAQFIKYWTKLMLSGAPALLKSGNVDFKLVNKMKKELDRLRRSKDSIFYYSYFQARAES